VTPRRCSLTTHRHPCRCPQSGFLFSFPFDPAGMNSKEMAVKEVKNGRLAMVGGGSLAACRLRGLAACMRGRTRGMAAGVARIGSIPSASMPARHSP
jgi:hypothetical protein